MTREESNQFEYAYPPVTLYIAVYEVLVYYGIISRSKIDGPAVRIAQNSFLFNLFHFQLEIYLKCVKMSIIVVII